LIALSPRATRQIRALRQHYEQRGRQEATRNLVAALESAWRTIKANPTAGLPAPRPYPELARPGRAWVHAGRYWIAYNARPPVAIIAVFYDAANIPGRL
jgi:plasmid stabilization system protein ParE